jgi:hypothetical protein
MFTVKPVPAFANGTDYAEVARYQQNTAELRRDVNHAGEELRRSQDLLTHMKAAAVEAPRAEASLFVRLDSIGSELSKLGTRLFGDRVRGGLNENSSPSIGGRTYNAANTWNTTQSATATQRSDFEIAKREFAIFQNDMTGVLEELKRLEDELQEAGAPSWR